jgi:two-component system NtrC family sensor kinase
MGRDTKTVGKLGKKRRPTGVTTKPRRAPKPKHANGPSVVNRESRVATLTRELREVLERQTATAGILQIIASSPSDVQPVFDAVADRAMRLLDCWSVIVTRFDGEYVQFGAARGALPDTEQFVRQRYQSMRPDRASLLGRSLLERTVVSSADAQAEPDPQLRDYARKRGLRAVLVVPLLRDDKVEGALVLSRAEPGLFAPREIELVQTFADQAVIAIQNARLFNETKVSLERQTATAKILNVIASSPTDTQPVFDVIARSATELCEGMNSGVYLLQDGLVHVAGHHNVSPEQLALAQTAFPTPPHRGIMSGRAILDRAVAHVPDIAADPEYTAESIVKAGFRSVVAVPMLRNGEPIGAINVTREEARPFSDRQIELLRTFADQAVIAIENVRLFKQLEARTRELSQSLDELRTAQDRLVQTEKLASLGQLTAGIAHEIKNPLNFVNNFSALSAELVGEMNDVLAKAALDKPTRDELDELALMLKSNLEKVVQHGKRADSIVKNMLQHSREGSGEHRPADINAIVDESLNLAYHGARAEKAGFSIALQRNLDPSVGMADVYPQEITRVLLNLISNGFYATTKRKAQADDGFEPLLSATTKNLGDKVEIRIRDNGIGIPAGVKEKIFDPFFTTKPSGEGTGLGLSMSHDIIVKQHGGSIEVETELGHFTEFKIVLPRMSQR